MYEQKLLGSKSILFAVLFVFFFVFFVFVFVQASDFGNADIHKGDMCHQCEV